jgi:hypothetical protein
VTKVVGWKRKKQVEKINKQFVEFDQLGHDGVKIEVD